MKKKMIKNDIVERVADKTGLHPAIVNAFFNNILCVMKEGIEEGNTIYLRGFGTFKIVKRKAKVGRNIGRNEIVNIPERMGVKFLKSDKLIIKQD